MYALVTASGKVISTVRDLIKIQWEILEDADAIGDLIAIRESKMCQNLGTDAVGKENNFGA